LSRIVSQYRLRAWHRPRTPWCFDRETAIDEGVALGLIHLHAGRRGTWTPYFEIMVEIEERRVAADQVMVRLAVAGRAG
jgi:hypothetical protein